MVETHPSTSEIQEWLREVADPEVPVLSVIDLGIVRGIEWTDDDELVIRITPTYSGCPAFEAIASDIRALLKSRRIARLRLETQLSPPWTTDWMTEDAKERLRAYGVAPPTRLVGISGIGGIEQEQVRCPRCGSDATELISRYGSTACKALYRCRACLEPFDVFKSH